VAIHGGSGSTMAVDYGEVTMASVGAKGGSFPSIGAMVKARDSTAATIGHSGVHTVARCMTELRRGHGYGRLGQGGGFPSFWLRA
jgi:hypothetical protein